MKFQKTRSITTSLILGIILLGTFGSVLIQTLDAYLGSNLEVTNNYPDVGFPFSNLSPAEFNSSSEINDIQVKIFGGSERDTIQDFIVDEDGYIYLCGYTKNQDFVHTSIIGDETYLGSDSHKGFIMKLSPNGGSMIFSTLIIGNDVTTVHKIRINPEGDLVITGITYASNLPVTANALDASKNGIREIYIMKIAGNGADVLYCSYFGGLQYSNVHGLDLDEMGNIYLCGNTQSTDFPVTSDAFDNTFSAGYGYKDGFFSIVNATGENLIYSTYVGDGSSKNAIVYAIKYKSPDLLYLAGSSENGKTLPVTPDALQLEDSGIGSNLDNFIMEFNLTDKSINYCSYFGGILDESHVFYMELDEQANIYIAGSTESNNLPTTSNASSTTLYGDRDVFLAKFSPHFEELLYCSYFGGILYDDIAGFSVIEENILSISAYAGSQPFSGMEVKSLFDTGGKIGINLDINISSNEIYNFNSLRVAPKGIHSLENHIYSQYWNETKIIAGTFIDQNFTINEQELNVIKEDLDNTPALDTVVEEIFIRKIHYIEKGEH